MDQQDIDALRMELDLTTQAKERAEAGQRTAEAEKRKAETELADAKRARLGPPASFPPGAAPTAPIASPNIPTIVLRQIMNGTSVALPSLVQAGGGSIEGARLVACLRVEEVGREDEGAIFAQGVRTLKGFACLAEDVYGQMFSDFLETIVPAQATGMFGRRAAIRAAFSSAQDVMRKESNTQTGTTAVTGPPTASPSFGTDQSSQLYAGYKERHHGLSVPVSREPSDTLLERMLSHKVANNYNAVSLAMCHPKWVFTARRPLGPDEEQPHDIVPNVATGVLSVKPHKQKDPPITNGAEALRALRVLGTAHDLLELVPEEIFEAHVQVVEGHLDRMPGMLHAILVAEFKIRTSWGEMLRGSPSGATMLHFPTEHATMTLNQAIIYSLKDPNQVWAYEMLFKAKAYEPVVNYVFPQSAMGGTGGTGQISWMQQGKQICKNFNLYGCKDGPTCNREHACALCGVGQQHALRDKHPEMARALVEQYHASKSSTLALGDHPR